MVFTSTRPDERDLFIDSCFLFKIKNCYNLKSSRAVRIEITYLTKGVERLKTKNCGSKNKGKEIKKTVGTGAGC